MILKIPAHKRHHADHDWLKTYHLFSFNNYFDPANLNFGLLRVFNDDYIAGESGFGMHSHQNMEIVTIVLEGELSHQDSLGNSGTIRSGEVQHMSAGTGVTHAEVNKSKDKVHLYQIWILPKSENIPPSYAQKDFSQASNLNSLLPVASGEGNKGALAIHADATIYTSRLEADKTIEIENKPGQGVFVYLTSGKLKILDQDLETGDQARIQNETNIKISASELTEFILIETAIE